ncbi:MAG: hypothetical protein IPQ19_04455 [Bacteroidetes bacterium]|nr:hypothetical protein [Bacteroidota bacterium]
MKYYEYDLDKAKDNKYLISYLENSETKQLELRLEGITLHFFNTGVGVLTYNLSNIFESQKERIPS